jgi:hypothetical protein
MCSVCADRAYGPLEPRGSDMVGVGGHLPPGWLINSFPMYLDKIRLVRVTDMRGSGPLTLDMDRVAVTLQGDDGAPVSTEVGVVPVRMRPGNVFLQFICGSCGRRTQVPRLHAGRTLCGRCTGLRYFCEGKPAVRCAQRRIERLKATRFNGGPGSHRPGRSMERRAQLMTSLRWSEAVARRHFAGRIVAALKDEPRSHAEPPFRCGLQ